MTTPLEDIEPLLIDPSADWPSEATGWPPVVFVDLNSSHATALNKLPPYPVIGIGDATHPIAAQLDAVVQAPVSAAALLRQIRQAPLAAAVTVQLLRCSADLPSDRALLLESLSYGLLQGSGEHARWLVSREVPPEALAKGEVHVEREGDVLRVTLDRPAARNAIDRSMRDRLYEAFTLATMDVDIRRVELRAVGNVFSMGGDLAEFGTTRDPATAHLIRSRTLPAAALIGCADRMSVHVSGACVGAGVEIAAFARRVTATANAWFQLPELSMGLMPGAGGCVSIPRRIGRQRAVLLMLSGKRIAADVALRWGLIDAIV